MDRKTRAKLLLLEVRAIQDGNYEGRTGDLLTLVNEIVRDAQALAEETIEQDDTEDKKAA